MTLRDQLERFHAAITGRAPLASALDLVEAGSVGAREQATRIEPDAAMARVDELERLHVYEHAYTARIAGVLLHDYPKLAQLVGENVLRSWTASYLRAYPPTNFSLREVGAHLARWLDREHDRADVDVHRARGLVDRENDRAHAGAHVGAHSAQGLVDRENDRAHADTHAGAHSAQGLVDHENHHAHADAHVGAHPARGLVDRENDRAHADTHVGAHSAQGLVDRENDRAHADTHAGAHSAQGLLDHENHHPHADAHVGARPRVWADLARLERARTEVFDGPDATPLSREDLATLDPAEFPSLKLRLVPSSRVIQLDTTADEVWDFLENDTPPSMCGYTSTSDTSTSDTSTSDASTSNASTSDTSTSDTSTSDTAGRVVLVWRRDLVVIHRTLDADEARIVPTMIAGTTFGAVCELLDEETAAERAIELLVRWLDAQILQRA